MSETLTHHPCLSRRDLVRGGIAGVGVVCLAACSGSPEEYNEEQPPDEQANDPTDEGENGDDAGEDGRDDEGGDDEGAIAAVDDIPVGGALEAELDGQPILLTRVDEDTVAAFSAICTHEGCQVQPGDGELACPCHGSLFDLADGEATAGPANDPLPQVEVEVVDGQVVAA